MNLIKIFFAAGALALAGSAASAATVFIGTVNGNDPFPGNLEVPETDISTPALYKCDDIDENDPSCVDEYTAAGGDGVFDVVFNDSMSGTWSWTADAGNLTPIAPHYMVLKAGNMHAVYELTDGSIFGGMWDTSDLDGKDISHISWYNTGIVIPLPAAGWLLIGGLGGLMVLRRRKS